MKVLSALLVASMSLLAYDLPKDYVGFDNPQTLNKYSKQQIIEEYIAYLGGNQTKKIDKVTLLLGIKSNPSQVIIEKMIQTWGNYSESEVNKMQEPKILANIKKNFFENEKKLYCSEKVNRYVIIDRNIDLVLTYYLDKTNKEMFSYTLTKEICSKIALSNTPVYYK